jgi:acetylserotonin N-methyltransferase
MSTQLTPEPDPGLILDHIEAFRRSKAMFTAVRLGVFDLLESRPQSAAELAAQIKAKPAALDRLLSACVALGLLQRDGEFYRNTPSTSRYLVSSSPHTFAGYVVYSDESLFHLWAHLDDAVREGSNRWSQAFGSRDALFDYYYRDPQATANFVRAMNGFGVLVSDRIVRAFDLSRFRHLVDLGGATGHLAIAACEAYPDLRATVVDLARVEPFALEQIAQSSVSDRVDFAVADFFADSLPPGDLYALGRILHDWDDTRTHALLAKIAAALPPGGGLLVAEALVNDERSGPVYALMQDLNMLVCTDGRERTLDEYRRLLEAAGFQDVDGRRTGSLVDAIFAVKPVC